MGLIHPKSPRAAQRDLLRASARVLGEGGRSLDLLGMAPEELKRRLRQRGAAVEEAPKAEAPEEG